jgi:hypothetical protein
MGKKSEAEWARVLTQHHSTTAGGAGGQEMDQTAMVGDGGSEVVDRPGPRRTIPDRHMTASLGSSVCLLQPSRRPADFHDGLALDIDI